MLLFPESLLFLDLLQYYQTHHLIFLMLHQDLLSLLVPYLQHLWFVVVWNFSVESLNFVMLSFLPLMLWFWRLTTMSLTTH